MSTNIPSVNWSGARPTHAAVKPTGLTADFLKNPLLFMRTHSMSPPSDSGATWTGDHGVVAATTHAAASNFDSSINEGTFGATVERRTGAGGIRHVQFIKHPDLNFPGAVGLKIAPANGFVQDGSWVPIYFLPWKSLNILSYTIPAIPHSLADWDDEEYPRFFYTAGINGCSVFASGSPQGPTVSHAGLNAKLSRSAGEFWRMQMAITRSGYSANAIRGEVNAHDYMFKGGQARQLADDYLKFLGSGNNDFKLEIQSPFGCVFGIRYGRSWTLYLQKSVVFDKVRFYKKSEVRKTVVNPHRTDIFAKDTGLLARQQPSNFVPRKLGFVPLPGQKEVEVYSTSLRFSLPLQVAEMFPNSRTIGELKDVFKVG
jgi:hypothetical protein